MVEENKTTNIEKVKSSIQEAKKVLSKKKETEKKVELDRVYVVPLRKGYLKVPQYKRGKKAVKTLKEFLAKHMKVEDRDLNKVKIDIYLNNEIWFRGIKKPLNKVKVHAKKIDGIVYAELEDVPEIVKYKMQKDSKKKTKVDKSALNKVISNEAKEEKEKEDREDKENIEEMKGKNPEGMEVKDTQLKQSRPVVNIKPAAQDKMSSTNQRKALKK